MKLAPIAPTHAPDVLIRPGDTPPLLDDDIRNDPNARFVRVYNNEVFAMMGAVSLLYGHAKPDRVELGFLTYDLARIADGILKDTVLGANLVYTDPQGVPYDMTQPAADWAMYPTNFARVVASMPGVASYVWGGPQTFLFTATSPEARVKLQQLVERKLDGAWGARWSGECSGPGCKPGPVPPTGEV